MYLPKIMKRNRAKSDSRNADQCMNYHGCSVYTLVTGHLLEGDLGKEVAL